MSYWHCEWVNELVLEIYFTQTMRMYWRKMDPETPPGFRNTTIYTFINMKKNKYQQTECGTNNLKFGPDRSLGC